MRLGKVQKGVLDSLRRHGYWENHYSCRWVWFTPSETERILDSLLKKGLVIMREEGGRDVYRPADENAKED